MAKICKNCGDEVAIFKCSKCSQNLCGGCADEDHKCFVRLKNEIRDELYIDLERLEIYEDEEDGY